MTRHCAQSCRKDRFDCQAGCWSSRFSSPSIGSKAMGNALGSKGVNQQGFGKSPGLIEPVSPPDSAHGPAQQFRKPTDNSQRRVSSIGLNSISSIRLNQLGLSSPRLHQLRSHRLRFRTCGKASWAKQTAFNLDKRFAKSKIGEKQAR
jgi:hypothetical protein